MTDAQRTDFYIPKWLEIQAKTDWRIVGGRLVADLDAQLSAARNFPDHAQELLCAIIKHARQIAQTECRAVIADDLRRGCNFVAAKGRTDSSRKFGRTDFNHFDRVHAVLVDPWDLTATMAWMDPAEDDRKRTLIYLRKIANEGRLRAITLNAWSTSDVDSLDQARLDALIAEIKKNAWSKYPRADKRERHVF
ncbi:MAG TPA: hypothetical protein VGO57_08525 [Verrucomicrobiae bacterium]|jgi:hypothetical protein